MVSQFAPWIIDCRPVDSGFSTQTPLGLNRNGCECNTYYQEIFFHSFSLFILFDTGIVDSCFFSSHFWELQDARKSNEIQTIKYMCFMFTCLDYTWYILYSLLLYLHKSEKGWTIGTERTIVVVTVSYIVCIQVCYSIGK